jgi:RNA polymerase sigma-70 factor (family 1)
MVRYGELVDDELVRLLKAGDEFAFTEIYTRYWPLLFRHARRMLNDEDEAMDVVQDVFSILWENAMNNSAIITLKNYLFVAVRHRTLNAIAKGKRREDYISSLAIFIDKGDYATDNLVAFNEFVKQMENEVANLPPKMREVFDMSRNLGYSHKEIAERLQISDHAVKKSINRALKILKAQLSSVFFFFLF